MEEILLSIIIDREIIEFTCQQIKVWIQNSRPSSIFPLVGFFRSHMSTISQAIARHQLHKVLASHFSTLSFFRRLSAIQISCTIKQAGARFPMGSNSSQWRIIASEWTTLQVLAEGWARPGVIRRTSLFWSKPLQKYYSSIIIQALNDRLFVFFHGQYLIRKGFRV